MSKFWQKDRLSSSVSSFVKSCTSYTWVQTSLRVQTLPNPDHMTHEGKMLVLCYNKYNRKFILTNCPSQIISCSSENTQLNCYNRASLYNRECLYSCIHVVGAVYVSSSVPCTSSFSHVFYIYLDLKNWTSQWIKTKLIFFLHLNIGCTNEFNSLWIKAIEQLILNVLTEVCSLEMKII